MKKIVLLSHDDSETARDSKFIEIIANILNCEFIHNSSFDLNLVDSVASDLAGLFLDFSSGDQIILFRSHFEERLNKNLIHVIVDPTRLDLFPSILRKSNLGHIVFRKYDQLEKEAELYAKVVASAQQEKKNFDLSVLFPNIKIEQIKLTSLSQRETLIQNLLQKLVNFQVAPAITQSIVNAVDELLMNAMYDSRTESRIDPFQKSTEILSKDRSAIEIQFAIDSSCFAASVTDLMGSIDRDKLFSRIAKSYNEKLNIDLSLAKTGLGAGLGLSMVLRSGGSLLLTCEPGERTTAILIFKITKRVLDFKRQFQFISTQFNSAFEIE